MAQTGTLFVVATPIGNLGDISHRMIEVLTQVDVVCAEDSRQTSKLLKYIGINKKIIVFHDHNEDDRLQSTIKMLEDGRQVALVCDAGTPLISDPGYGLIYQLRQKKYPIQTVPGPCAAIAALSISGLPTDTFYFAGFLPAKSGQRCNHLNKLKQQTGTLVFYESVHRIAESLEDMAMVLDGSRTCTVARELTKLYETVKTGTLTEMHAFFRDNMGQRKGEFVVLVQGYLESETKTITDSAYKTLEVLIAELGVAQAVKLAAKITGYKKNQLYQEALKLSNTD